MRNALLFAFVALALPRVALACSTCGCGDPTINVMGTAPAQRGWVRLSLQGGWRRLVEPGPTPATPWRIDEGRIDLSAAGSPDQHVVISGTLPLVALRLQTPFDAVAHSFTWGDLDLRVRVTAWQSKLREHRIGVTAGWTLPTALRLKHEGRPLIDELQVGTGSWTPLLGLWYGWQKGWFSGFTSATGQLPIGGWDHIRPGAVGLFSTQVQIQPIPEVAPRLLIEARITDTWRDHGVPENLGGGWLVALTPGVTVSPRSGLLLFATLRVPVAQKLQGILHEGLQPQLGISYDL